MSEVSLEAESLKRSKPGWFGRIFEIETGLLIACDARRQGDSWTRGEEFTFLYRSRRGKFFVLRDPRNWTVATEEAARKLYQRLPVKLSSEAEAFRPAPLEKQPPSRDDDDDELRYQVVANETAHFSIWPEHKELPHGWRAAGFTGTKRACLEHIERSCVFGATHP
jgi:uncharacterized protein YbdZ (MbtH family)